MFEKENPFMSSFIHGMNFASTPALGDMGDAGAGGDDGGAGGGGTADDGADDGASEEEIPEGTEGGADESGEGEEAEQGDEDGGEGGRVKPGTPEQQAKAVEKAINKFRESNPEGAKLIRREHFQNQEFREVFKSPAEARQAREVIADLGGSEGITKMRGEVEEYSAELSRMANGDPQAVEELARDFPKGLAKLVPHALDKMRSIDPNGYERLVSRAMSTAMFEKGFTHSVDRALELVMDGKQEQAAALIKQMRDWIASADRFGKEKPAEAASDEMSEVERGRAEVESQKKELFDQRVASTVTTSMNRIIGKHLNPLIADAAKRGRKLTLEQKQLLASNTYTQIANRLKSDKAYQGNLRRLLKEGDIQKIDRFVSSEVARIARKSANAVWDTTGFASSGSRTKVRDGNGNNGTQQVKVGRKPPAEQIDWTKDRSKMRYMSGEATLKKEFGGKVVKWDRNSL